MNRSKGLDRRGRRTPGEYESRESACEGRWCVFVFAGLGKGLISTSNTRTEQAKRTPANRIKFPSADQLSLSALNHQRKSIYLSLHPKPVVSPIPPLSSLPSRCLVRLLGVSLASLRCLDDVLTFEARDRLDALERQEALDRCDTSDTILIRVVGSIPKFGCGNSFELGESIP